VRPRGVFAALAVAMTSGALACGSGAKNREQRIDVHEQRAAAVRESETAQRLATPTEPGRIIYEAPTDLSMDNARRTGAAIIGIEKVPQPAYDSTSKSASSPGGAGKP
jgi:hypothetical protein